MFIGVGVVGGRVGLAPEADAEDDVGLGGRAALGAGEVGGGPVALGPVHADVGGHLAADLVAETEADLGVVEARPDAPVGHLLERRVHLQPGLGHEPLCEQQVVGPDEPGREVARGREEDGGLDLEEVGREPLEPDDEVGPGADVAVAELGIDADARLGLEVRRDEAAVERLRLRLADALGDQPLPFSLDVEPGVVRPDAVEPLETARDAGGGRGGLEEVEKG